MGALEAADEELSCSDLVVSCTSSSDLVISCTADEELSCSDVVISCTRLVISYLQLTFACASDWALVMYS